MARSGANRRTETGATLLIFLGLAANVGAGELGPLPAARQAGATKTLSFPPDRWVGSLLLEPDSGPGWDTRGVRLFGEWERFGPARGDVRVPRDRHVWLNIHLGLNPREAARWQRENPQAYRFEIADRVHEPPGDLSALLRLDPNDLFRLSVSSSMQRRTGTAPAVFEPIGRLTGLRVLTLQSSGITDAGLMCLRPLRSLKALELTQSSIGPRGLAVLKDLPALEHLDLTTAVTDAGLKEVAQASGLRSLRITKGNMFGPGLAELAKLPRLEQLCIQSNVSDRHIQQLERLPHLKVLSLWYVDDTITDASLASIAKIESLEELYFIMSSPKFTPAGVAHLKNLKHLKKVDFGPYTWAGPAGERHGDEVARQLAGIPSIESIQGVSCLSAEGVKTLSGLRNLKCLDIVLRGAWTGYQGPSGLSCLTGLKSLETLRINRSDIPLSDDDLVALESLSGLKNLLLLCPAVSDRGMTSIGKLKQLEDLTLMTKVSRNGLNRLNGLSRLHHLQVNSINMPGEIIPSEEATLDLSGLKSMKNMNLTGVPLHDEDLAFLSRLSSLKTLMLQPSTPLRGESLRHLANLPELDRLWLCNLSDCSGEDMTQLSRPPKLGHLIVSGDLADRALASLAGSPRLEWLDVNTNAPIRRQTVADLAAKIPQLESIHVRELPPWITRPVEAGKDARTRSPGANRRPATTGRDGRK